MNESHPPDPERLDSCFVTNPKSLSGASPSLRPNPPSPPRKSLWRFLAKCIFGGCVVISALLLLLVAVAVISVIAFLSEGGHSFSSGSGESIHETLLCGSSDSARAIAVIDISGVIVSGSDGGLFSEAAADSERICALIRHAKMSSDVVAILVRIDSPGGEVTASDRIYHELVTSEKPVVAMLNSLAASGGYYVAAGAKKIVACRTTLTGSIGVIIQTINYKGLSEKIGVHPQFYTSGAMKTMLSGATDPTPQEQAVVQALVHNSYRLFASIVAESRGIPLETVTGTEIGDGRIFDAEQALRLNLIDQIGTFDDSILQAATLAGVTDYRVIHLSRTSSFLDTLLSARSDATSAKTNSLRIALPGGSSLELRKGVPYYLSTLGF